MLIPHPQITPSRGYCLNEEVIVGVKFGYNSARQARGNKIGKENKYLFFTFIGLNKRIRK